MLMLKCDNWLFFFLQRIEGECMDRKDYLKHLLSHPRSKVESN